jgi:hypothetical protein
MKINNQSNNFSSISFNKKMVCNVQAIFYSTNMLVNAIKD